MVVRRCRGHEIRLIHVTSGDDLTIKIVDLDGFDKQIVFRLGFRQDRFSIPGLNRKNELMLGDTDSFRVRHRDGDFMDVEIAGVKHCDANIRLVDKPHFFKFEWVR